MTDPTPSRTIPEGIRLITLDLDDTLWPLAPVIHRAEQQGWDCLCRAYPALAEHTSLDAFRASRLSMWQSQPQLRHNLSELRKAATATLLQQAGMDSALIPALVDESFAVFYNARNRIELFPGALEALQQLARSYPLIALSNGNADLARIGLRDLFSAHFNAENTGASKPDPAMFNAALHHAGVSASETLHIGDDPHLDVLAAQQLGMHTVWFNHHSQPRAWPEALPRAGQEWGGW